VVELAEFADCCVVCGFLAAELDGWKRLDGVGGCRRMIIWMVTYLVAREADDYKVLVLCEGSGVVRHTNKARAAWMTGPCIYHIGLGDPGALPVNIWDGKIGKRCSPCTAE
jgi:hypothetical protein